jgi:5-(carboxyamino)imidazole ribonucleotide mutase
MPQGVPVATVALNGSGNAGILAAQIVASGDQNMLEKIIMYKKNLENQVHEKSENLKRNI